MSAEDVLEEIFRDEDSGDEDFSDYLSKENKSELTKSSGNFPTC